jgi:hypothetical protein
MSLTWGSMEAKSWSRRCRVVWQSEGRNLAGGDAVTSAHSHGEAHGGDGGSMRPPGRAESEREEQRRE